MSIRNNQTANSQLMIETAMNTKYERRQLEQKIWPKMDGLTGNIQLNILKCTLTNLFVRNVLFCSCKRCCMHEWIEWHFVWWRQFIVNHWRFVFRCKHWFLVFASFYSRFFLFFVRSFTSLRPFICIYLFLDKRNQKYQKNVFSLSLRNATDFHLRLF